MSLFESLVLGIFQGLTEFLPISSSGHLVLLENLFGLEIAELKSFDVLVHMGTLLAILIYFRKDLWSMILSFFKAISGNFSWKDPYIRLIFYIIVATLPAVVAGLLFGHYMDEKFRNIEAVGIFMIIVGFVFILGEYSQGKIKKSELNFKNTLIIGLAQSVALIPGVSRSGSTIVAGLFQGVSREESARFSFLLAIPAIVGAGLLTAIKTGPESSLNLGLGVMTLGFLSSFIAGLFTISFLMKFLKKYSLKVFAAYLIVLGLFVSISQIL